MTPPGFSLRCAPNEATVSDARLHRSCSVLPDSLVDPSASAVSIFLTGIQSRNVRKTHTWSNTDTRGEISYSHLQVLGRTLHEIHVPLIDSFSVQPCSVSMSNVSDFSACTDSASNGDEATRPSANLTSSSVVPYFLEYSMNLAVSERHKGVSGYLRDANAQRPASGRRRVHAICNPRQQPWAPHGPSSLSLREDLLRPQMTPLHWEALLATSTKSSGPRTKGLRHMTLFGQKRLGTWR